MDIIVPPTQPGQRLDPPNSLRVGDRVKFAEEVQRYTVRAITRDGRFAICTKPFNPMRTVLYTVIDFDRGVRGTDNYYGLGYETDDQVADALHEFQHTEDSPNHRVQDCEDTEFCRGGAEVSRRTHNNIPLRIASIRRKSGDA